MSDDDNLFCLLLFLIAHISMYAIEEEHSLERSNIIICGFIFIANKSRRAAAAAGCPSNCDPFDRPAWPTVELCSGTAVESGRMDCVRSRDTII